MWRCRPPHLSDGRAIQPGQMIHASAIEYMNRHKTQQNSGLQSPISPRLRADSNSELPTRPVLGGSSSYESESDLDFAECGFKSDLPSESEHSTFLVTCGHPPNPHGGVVIASSTPGTFQGLLQSAFSLPSRLWQWSRSDSPPSAQEDDHPYVPKAHLPPGYNWDAIASMHSSSSEYRSLIVEDLYASAEHCLRRLKEGVEAGRLTRTEIDPFLALVTAGIFSRASYSATPLIYCCRRQNTVYHRCPRSPRYSLQLTQTATQSYDPPDRTCGIEFKTTSGHHWSCHHFSFSIFGPSVRFDIVSSSLVASEFTLFGALGQSSA